jgi:hypothetical protein
MQRSSTTQSTTSSLSKKVVPRNPSQRLSISVDPLTLAVALGILPAKILEPDTHCVSE